MYFLNNNQPSISRINIWYIFPGRDYCFLVFS